MNNDYLNAFESLEGLQKMYPDFSAHSQYFTDKIPLLKSRELGNYQLLQTFQGTKAASVLLGEVSKLLGITNKDTMYSELTHRFPKTLYGTSSAMNELCSLSVSNHILFICQKHRLVRQQVF